MPITVKSNGSIHKCSICIHEDCCKKTESSLINFYKKRKVSEVYVPQNCPILTNRDGKERVIFT